MKELKMFIDGQFVENESGKWINVLNPSTEEVISLMPDGTAEDARKAIDAAEQAQPAWERIPAIQRASYLRKIAEGIRAREAELTDIIVREGGKTQGLANVEVLFTADYLDYMAEWARRYEGEIVQSDRPNESIFVSSEAKKEFEKSVKTESAANLETLSKVENEKELAGIMTRVINAIKAKDYDSVSDCFSEDGLEMYKKLLNYGQARLLGDPQFSFYTMGKRVVCRSIPMAFSFKNNRRKFVEDVTFTFDENKKIECVAFGLGSQAKTDIFNKGVGAWSDYAKMVIATFLENYKTAFALKRLDYLESVFDDNATIITGHIIKKAPKVAMEGESFINSNNKLIKYTRQTKSEYMRKLKMCFQSNQFINIRFADNDVVKMGAGGETYGIQIKQDYYSTNYGDHGYLFLMVDFNDPDNPSIKVRTWQPDRNPNINSNLPRSNRDWGIIGPGNF